MGPFTLVTRFGIDCAVGLGSLCLLAAFVIGMVVFANLVQTNRFSLVFQPSLLLTRFSKNLSQNGHGEIGSAFVVTMVSVPNTTSSIQAPKVLNILL